MVRKGHETGRISDGGNEASVLGIAPRAVLEPMNGTDEHHGRGWGAGWLMAALVVVALIYGLVSGLRVPNLWASTALILDYHAGFAKRGLLGAMLGLSGEPKTYGDIAVLAFALLALWVVLFLVYARRAAALAPDVWIVVAAFFVSQGFLFEVHAVGYADHVGLLLGIVCLMLPVSVSGLVARAVALAAMILIHEGLFLFMVPVVFFDLLVRGLMRPGGAGRRLWGLFGFGALAMAALTYGMAQASLPPGGVDAAVAYYGEIAWDYPVREDTVAVQYRGSDDNRAFIAEVWADPETPGHVRWALATNLPYVLVMLGLCFGAVRRFGLRRGQAGLIALGAVVVAVMPVAVLVWAWDFERFMGQTQITVTLALLILIHALGARGRGFALGRVGLGLLVAASVWNASATPRLFDEAEVRRPPYGADLSAAWQAWTAWDGRIRPPDK